MKGVQLLGIALILFSASPAAAEQVKVSAYDLDVEFVPGRHFMSAAAGILFEDTPDRPDTLVFFLHGELVVDSLSIGDRMIAVRQSSEFYYYNYSLVARKVEIDIAGHALKRGLTVWYSGFFHPSRARTPSDYMRVDPDGVLLRSYGYSLWFPVFLEDGRDSYEVSFPRVRIRTPEDFVSVFVGERISARTESGTLETEWRAENVDLMHVQCTARRFAVESDGSYHVYYIDEPGSRDTARRIIEFTRSLTGFYRTHYRKTAAAGQIHIMQMPQFGDISSDNVAGISSDKWHNFDREIHSQTTLAHELVHPFVQLPVEMADPIYALVVEGFPSYFHLPALGELLGEEFYSDFLKSRENRYLRLRDAGRKRQSRSLPPEKPIYEITPDEIGTYKDRFVLCDRVLLFLDYLRARMGDDRFFAFTSELFQLDSLDRADFERVVLEHLPGAGEDLHLWLETTDYPERLRIPRRVR
jgi:hypothetical protein